MDLYVIAKTALNLIDDQSSLIADALESLKQVNELEIVEFE